MREQIARAPKPAQEGHCAKHVDRRDAVRLRVACMSGLGEMAQMKMPEMDVAHATREGEHAQHQPDTETDKVKRFPVHLDLFFCEDLEDAGAVAVCPTTCPESVEGSRI